MSVMDYGVSRRYSPHTDLSFPNYYYPERNTPLELSQAIRVDPRGYHLVGPVGGARGRPAIERGESMIGNGSSRRRIAVAVSDFDGLIFSIIAVWEAEGTLSDLLHIL
jgi:hypothetical protein